MQKGVQIDSPDSALLQHVTTAFMHLIFVSTIVNMDSMEVKEVAE